MNIAVYVVPGSKKFNIQKQDNRLKINLKSKAEKGKANLELIKELKKLTGKNVVILSGHRSRKKVLEIEDLSEDEFFRKI